jgi:hypothetical protein
MKVNVNYPLPTVHLNGTSRGMLLDGYNKILDAIYEVNDASNECEFHSRDYYVEDDESWPKALEERQRHLNNLHAFKQHILEHLMHLHEGVTNQNRKKTNA